MISYIISLMAAKTTLNPQLEEGWKKALAEEFGAGVYEGAQRKS